VATFRSQPSCTLPTNTSRLCVVPFRDGREAFPAKSSRFQGTGLRCRNSFGGSNDSGRLASPPSKRKGIIFTNYTTTSAVSVLGQRLFQASLCPMASHPVSAPERSSCPDSPGQHENRVLRALRKPTVDRTDSDHGLGTRPRPSRYARSSQSITQFERASLILAGACYRLREKLLCQRPPALTGAMRQALARKNAAGEDAYWP